MTCNPRPFPSGRYAHTNPLRRLFGLQLLTESLPEPLRSALIRAWLRPGRFDGNQAVQGIERQRPPAASLSLLPPRRLSLITSIELEVSRRLVEIPRTEITREARNWLLRSQAVYLAQVYAALVQQCGEAAAHVEFERRLLAVR